MKKGKVMKFKRSEDNKYRAQFTKELNKLMDKLTIKEFVYYLTDHAALTFTDGQGYINNEPARFKVFLLADPDISSIKDFVFTEDGKLYYCTENNGLNQLVDC